MRMITFSAFLFTTKINCKKALYDFEHLHNIVNSFHMNVLVVLLSLNNSTVSLSSSAPLPLLLLLFDLYFADLFLLGVNLDDDSWAFVFDFLSKRKFIKEGISGWEWTCQTPLPHAPSSPVEIQNAHKTFP